MKTKDPEFRILADISQSLEVDYPDVKQEWKDSSFGWMISRVSSRQKGAIGEELVSKWLTSHDFDVKRSPDSQADRVIEGKRVEIKFSMLWENGGYPFQQIRDQNYELMICFGISPSSAHCWVIPKADIFRLIKEEKIRRQYSGRQYSGYGGKEWTGTAWFSVPVNSVPEWLKPYGGSLSEALPILQKEFKNK